MEGINKTESRERYQPELQMKWAGFSPSDSVSWNKFTLLYYF
jgi:hypothetical protein